MTLEQLKNILQTTGMPVTYRAWESGRVPAMPYICYLRSYDNNMAADGAVYFTAQHVQIELYTQLVDPPAARKIMDALTNAGIYWDLTETYLDDERCYQTIFDCEV